MKRPFWREPLFWLILLVASIVATAQRLTTPLSQVDKRSHAEQVHAYTCGLLNGALTFMTSENSTSNDVTYARRRFTDRHCDEFIKKIAEYSKEQP